MKTIITPSEVVRYSDIDVNVPVCNFRQIQQIESYLFGTKLTSKLYDDMLSKLVDYSGVTTWKSTDTITIGVKKLYNGVVYAALQNSVGVLPTNYEYWDVAPKFSSECYEKFWCDVLANYLAIAILENRLPKIWIKVKSDGVVKQKGEMYDSASGQDYKTYHNAVIRDLEMCYYNVTTYMSNTECLKSYSLCGSVGEKRVQYNVG